MTEFTSETRPLPTLADFLDPPAYRDLSKPHISELIQKAMMSKNDVIDARVEGIMALGRIWEWVVRPDVKRLVEEAGLIYISPHSRECEGVIGTLDGAAYDGPVPVAVLETKLRFSSPFTDIRDYRRYMLQDKAYCHLLGAVEAWMPILHVQSRPPSAEYKWYRIRFTQVEIEENWRMLMNIRDDQ